MTETRWLDEREMRAWQAFLIAGALVERRVEQQLKEQGLSLLQHEVLVRLALAEDGELRMTELADSVVSSKSGLTYQIGQMEKAGLVRRRNCKFDVRGVFACLTDAGRAKLDEVAPGHVATVRQYLIDILDGEQLDNLAETLEKVAAQAARSECATATEGEDPCPTS